MTEPVGPKDSTTPLQAESAGMGAAWPTPDFSAWYAERRDARRRRLITAAVFGVVSVALLVLIIAFTFRVNASLGIILFKVAVLWVAAAWLIVHGVRWRRHIAGAVACFAVAAVLIAVGARLGVPVVQDLPYVNAPENVTVLNATVDRNRTCRMDDDGDEECYWEYYVRGVDANTGDSVSYGINESVYDACRAVRNQSGDMVANVPILPHTGSVADVVTCRAAE